MRVYVVLSEGDLDAPDGPIRAIFDNKLAADACVLATGLEPYEEYEVQSKYEEEDE